MSHSRLVALILAIASIGLLAFGLALSVSNAEAGRHPFDLLSVLGTAGMLIGSPSFTIVGAVIVLRYGRHHIGWIMIALGLSWGTSIVVQDYGKYTYITHPHSLPLGPLVASASVWIFMVNILLFFWLTMLFPTGHVTGRWCALFWLGSAGIVLEGFSQFVSPGPTNIPHVQNPYAVGHMPGIIDNLAAMVSLGALPGAVWSALYRLSRAHGVERLQIKWFMYGASVALILSMMATFSNWNGAVGIVATAAIVVLPFTIGAAMLRYRLYDIDVLINRTLVYGSLTVTLAALYLGSVIALQSLARTLTGQSSDLAIAIVTLAVAALFNPWRRRLQGFIDRRFYRRKYDAALILAAFTAQLRDEVDLDQLTSDLLAVAHDTVQPASVALWMCEPGGTA